MTKNTITNGGVATALAVTLAIPAACIGWQAGHSNLESLIIATCAALLASVYVILCVKEGQASA